MSGAIITETEIWLDEGEIRLLIDGLGWAVSECPGDAPCATCQRRGALIERMEAVLASLLAGIGAQRAIVEELR